MSGSEGKNVEGIVAIARAVAFAIAQPHDVEVGDITIRPTAQD